MDEYHESGRRSAEPLEQELAVRNAEIYELLKTGDYATAEQLASELAYSGQSPEFRLDGLHVLGKIASADGHVNQALKYLETARQLAVDTESYHHAADISRTIGLIHREKTGKREEMQRAFASRKGYEQAADQFPNRRFAKMILDD